jgi:hypothetical protein
VKKKRPPNPKKRLQIAIVIGISIIVAVIVFYYNLDQAKLTGQKFGDDLAQIQTDLNNETQYVNSTLGMYEKGELSKSQMLNIMDNHLGKMQNILTRYDNLRPPGAFAPSLELFRLSTQTQLESDKLLREWIQTGDNATRAKSDELLDQSVQYELNALQSYNNAKSNGS